MRRAKRLTVVLLIVMLLVPHFVFAADPQKVSKNEITLSATDNPTDIKIGEYVTFNKKITKVDDATKAIEMEMTLQQTQKVGTVITQEEVEFIFNIDISASMRAKSGDTTRFDCVKNATKMFIDKIFENIPKAKIGIVIFGKGANGNEEATKVTPSLVTASSANDLKAKIDALVADGYTPTKEGLEMSKSLLTTAKNQYIITLTDGLPTTGEAEAKAELLKLAENGVNLVTVLTDLNSGERYEETFGTLEKPTAGSLYSVNSTDLQNTLIGGVYNDITKKIKDKDIIYTDININNILTDKTKNNFQYALGECTEGTKAELKDGVLNWNVPKLGVGDTAKVKYTIKLNDEVPRSISGIDIKEIKNLTVDYKADEKVGEQLQNDASSLIKITVPELCTVTFDAKGGTPVPSIQYVNKGEKATQPTSKIEKKGYTFEGWRQEGKTETYNFESKVNTNIVLEAVWKQDVAPMPIPQTGEKATNIAILLTSIAVVIIIGKKYYDLKEVK